MGILLSSVKLTSDGVPYHTLKDFRLEEQVGSGGYGTVLKGIVAVKLFNGWDIYSKREIEILKTHTHEHIVQLFGVIWDEKDKDDPTKKPIYTGYVMEYMELGSLHKVYSPANKPNYFRRIGSDPYMAPEIVGTEKNYGAPADVYSFGVTIWEIIHRKDPSKHLKTSTDSSGIVSTELIMDADETYGGLTDLVKRCWQREISARPSIQEIINFEPKFHKTILVVGGGPRILVVGPDSDNNNKMTMWNRKTSTWTVSRMERPDHILSFGVVYLDDELYLINYDKALSKLDKNMEWKQLADMNEKRGIINNSCLEWNGYIWVFGGWIWDRREVLKSVERYDPKKNKWTRMPDMKYDRRGAAATVCNGKIYICGGIGYGNAFLKSVECFDPESGVWTELTDMPTPRCRHSLVCYRNKLVVLGGYDGKEWTTTVLELDPLEKNGQWKELSPLTSPLPSVTVVLGREIITIGCNTNDTGVEIFNGINWRVGPSFPPIIPSSLSAVLVPQEFADRLSSYPNELKQ